MFILADRQMFVEVSTKRNIALHSLFFDHLDSEVEDIASM
jgi:hypothetical protein